MDDTDGENMDPMSLVATAASTAAKSEPVAVEGAKTMSELTLRLLGPLADEKAQQWVERSRQKNLKRLMERTDARAVGAEPGTVPLRLAGRVFETAEYADDELITEYLSGIFASSRTPAGDDDSGIGHAALIGRLSKDALRLHYIVYASLRELVTAPESPIDSVSAQLHDKRIVLQLSELETIFRPDLTDNASWEEALSAALDALSIEGVLATSYFWGTADEIDGFNLRAGQKLKSDFPAALGCGVTVHGIRLYCWGLGAGRTPLDDYLDASRPIRLVDDALSIPPVSAAFDSDAFEVSQAIDG